MHKYKHYTEPHKYEQIWENNILRIFTMTSSIQGQLESFCNVPNWDKRYIYESALTPPPPPSQNTSIVWNKTEKFRVST